MGQNVINGHASTRVNAHLVQFQCKAKYAANSDGSRRLLAVEYATEPIFRPEGWEEIAEKKRAEIEISEEERGTDREANARRALGRAKVNAFDLIMCNADLDTFVTLTYSPEVLDRASYGECYAKLRPWLSNRVSRCGLKYILAPEYHHDGESIHLHAICNSSALKLERARSPKGITLYRRGKPLYNVADWGFGHSTAQIVPPEDGREAVAKYIFKYMGKQAGAQIGGRYFLHGGKLAAPVYEYSDSVAELTGGAIPTHTVEFEPYKGLSIVKHTYV